MAEGGGAQPDSELDEGLLVRKARSGLPLLLLGPSGAGKDVMARRIHALSGRAERPFVAENCAAIPAQLAESLLFGSERGSHTAASTRHVGFLEQVENGTLFLDEIAELDLVTQAKMLRALDNDGSFYRVGGREPLRFRGRVIVATNKDLWAEARAGRFREDLYFRVAHLIVKMRAVSERPDEVLAAATAELRRRAPEKRFALCALEALARCPWPGGFRRVEAVIARAALASAGRAVFAADIEEAMRLDIPEQAVLVGAAQVSVPPVSGPMLRRARPRDGENVPATVATARWARASLHVRGQWVTACEALEACAGVKQLAAKTLGISRQRLDGLLVAMEHPMRPKTRHQR
jgi:two-component system response regulator FlrC